MRVWPPSAVDGAAVKTCVALQYVWSAGSSGSTLTVATSLPSQLISTVVNVQFAAVPVTYQ